MIKTKQCGASACQRKGQQLPLSDFGFVKSRKDNKNLYCNICIADKVRRYRERLQVMRIARKPNIWKQQQVTSVELVMEAIIRGAHSRSEIQKSTRLGFDAIGDSLATLRFENNVLRSRVVEGDRQFFLAA